MEIVNAPVSPLLSRMVEAGNMVGGTGNEYVHSHIVL